MCLVLCLLNILKVYFKVNEVFFYNLVSYFILGLKDFLEIFNLIGVFVSVYK